MNAEDAAQQRAVCRRFGTAHCPVRPHRKVGVSITVLEGNRVYPLHGLRLPRAGDATGWFVWSGEGGRAGDFDLFRPLSVEHLGMYCAEVLPYLGLGPGWRFLIGPGYEDVWFDRGLLQDGDEGTA